ncbi:hypothetical protein [uncultured Sphaerochaeta sp.]|nr:hypothetical protein [uncultured Sphaerochaeta sp.]
MLFALSDLRDVSSSEQGTRYSGQLTSVQKRVNELLHLGLET